MEEKTKMKKILIILLAVSSSKLIAQYKVLDAPFIAEKIHIFQPYPMELDWALRDKFWYGYSKDSVESKTFFDNYPFYELSHLYSEPEYARVRVIRTINLNTNNQFSKNISSFIWEGKNSKWTTPKDSTDINSYINENYSVEFNLPWWIRKFLNVNIKEIKASPQPYSREKSALSNVESLMKKNIEKGFIQINEDGILKQVKDYQPDFFTTIPITKLIFNSCSEGMVTPYFDKDFYNPMTKVEFINNVNYFKQFSGIKLKEDYFFDPVSDKFVSAIIGFAMLDDLGKELCWFYYPELRYTLENSGTIIENKIMDYMYVFDEHHYNSSIDSLYGIAAYQGEIKTDGFYLLKLLPLTKIKIHNEESKDKILNKTVTYEKNNNLEKIIVNFYDNIPNGLFKSYFDNGKLSCEGNMINGYCSGIFKYYFPNGNIKAIRIYKNGILDGEQKNYYENGNLYAKYTVEQDVILSLERYYSDNILIEKGAFNKGLFYGDWEYNIKCSENLYQLIDKYRYDKTDSLIYNNGIIHLKVNYEHEYKEQCPPLVYRNQYLNICIKSTIIK